tara:strand:- start:3945 stop:5552 length:1608 start_codon:yes stop_codon:yes gene_type:complete
MRKVAFYLLIISPFLLSSSDIEPKVKNIGKVHVISIGINTNYRYKSPLGNYEGDLVFKNCENDSKAILEKIINENTAQIGKTFLLNNKNATLENVRNAFKSIIKVAKPDDAFIFFFAGISFSSTNFETFFLLHQKNTLIKTSEIASLMNQILCNRQLIISEAGSGKEFSNSLMSYLFEDNPEIANNTKLERTILTTPSYGLDISECDKTHAPLMSYILKSGNIINAFNDIRQYELILQQRQTECPERQGAYFIIRKESDFRDLLAFNYRKFNSRGTITKSKPKEEIEGNSKTYAFVVATDNYNKNQDSWDDLKNPIKDADAVSNILEKKFNVKVVKVYNKTRNEILKEFIIFKNRIGKNDKLIFFVAGHGYFSEDFSDGFLVLNDSKALKEDKTFESYLPMAKLNRLLNGISCKQTFTIFDVCFGSSFELNSNDVKLSNYSKMNSDISIDEFIKRKEKYTSRIFLASGKAEVPDYWSNSLNHSPFANKLINYLKNEKEFLSPSKIYEALEANITEPIMKSYGSHEERGDFILKVK